MTRDISNSADILDSRDIIKRIEELEEMEVRDDDEQSELKALKALEEEAEGYSDDWRYGATLIRDSYFQEYAKQLADEVGAIDGKQNWPLNCIDWEEAADQLKQDYTLVDFDGVDYWVR